jgi:hypothetical protein
MNVLMFVPVESRPQDAMHMHKISNIKNFKPFFYFTYLGWSEIEVAKKLHQLS